MVNYEFQARRIGRMSDYIDRRTATLGLHAACLEQQARELRRDAENMRRVVIGDSVDKDKLRDENADTDGTCQWRQTDAVCGDPTVEDTRWCAEHVDRWNGVRHLTGDDESQADDDTTPYSSISDRHH